MASYKISQQDNDAAVKYLLKSHSAWKDIEGPLISNPFLFFSLLILLVVDLNALPSWNFRVQTAKLFIELEQFEPAAEVLTQLNDEHDEDAEIWYLLGFSLNHFDPDSALECLQKCKEVPSLLPSPCFYLKEMKKTFAYFMISVNAMKLNYSDPMSSLSSFTFLFFLLLLLRNSSP